MRRYLSLPLLARALLLFPLLSPVQVDAQVTVTPGTSVRDDAGTAIDLCIQSSSPVEEGITVDYAISDGTAIQGEDFMLNVTATGSITIPMNGTTACLNNSVTYVVDNDFYETDQYYEFSITGPNVTDGMSSTQYVIEDSTPAPQLTFGLSMYVFNEGELLVEVTVTTGGVFVQSPAVVTDTVTVSSGTAEEGPDFIVSVMMVSIPDGESMASFDITINDDDVYEGTEGFTLELSSSGVFTTVTIEDNEELPKVVVNAPAFILKPERIVDLCVRVQSGPVVVVAITVGYSVTGNEAELGKDFTVLNGTAGDIVFEPGTLEQCIVLEILDDFVFEANETITFELTSTSEGTLGVPSTVTIPIVDNEPFPSLFVISPSQVNESSTEGVVICVNVTVPSAFGIDVLYQFVGVGNDATETEDYNVPAGPSGTLEFQPLQEQDCVTVEVMDDMVYEGNEMFEFQLSNPENASLGDPSVVTITIIDDDFPVLSIQSLSLPVEEMGGNISVCVEASVSSKSMNRVSFAVTDGNTTLSEDYVVFPNASGHLTFEAMTTTECINIYIVDDDVYEGTEYFMFVLLDPTDAKLDDQNSSINITIADDETSPMLTLQAPSVVDESVGNFSICVNSSGPSAIPITVDCQITDISTTRLVDYTISGNDGFVLRPTETTVCSTIRVVDDMEFEGDELLSIELVDPTIAGLGEPNAVNVTIVDNDPSPVPSPSPSSASPSTTEPTAEADTLLYIIIGAVGGAVLAAFVFLFLIIIIIACCRVKVNRQGFYVTDEDKGEAPQMLRYSASLRSISSQTVVPVDTRDKENEYMV